MTATATELDAGTGQEKPAAAWEQDPTAGTETWYRDRKNHAVRGYVSQYGPNANHNWQAIRGNYRLSGSAPDSKAAMAAADAALTLSIEEFNARVVEVLVEKMKDLETKILALAPTSQLLPGYHAGYEAGTAAMRKSIEEALQ